MQFDVIVGNPPYQLGQSGGDVHRQLRYADLPEVHRGSPSDSNHATSRWLLHRGGSRAVEDSTTSGGRCLLTGVIRSLVDYPDSREVFAWCRYSWWRSPISCGIRLGTTSARSPRFQAAWPARRCVATSDDYDILVRYNEAVSILERVLDRSDDDAFDSLASQVSPIQPFSIRTHFRGAPSSDGMADPVLIFQSGGTGFIERDDIPRNVKWVDEWTVFLSRTASEHGGQADKSGTRRVFSRILIGGPGTACTETYLVAGRFTTEAEAKNFGAYLRTKFVRLLVSLRTNTQDLYSERFAFVPRLPMDREWTDEMLYKMYGITKNEIAFIDSMIRPMS